MKSNQYQFIVYVVAKHHAEALQSHPTVVQRLFSDAEASLFLSTSPVPKAISTNIHVKRMASLQGNTGKYRKEGSISVSCVMLITRIQQPVLHK